MSKDNFMQLNMVSLDERIEKIRNRFDDAVPVEEVTEIVRDVLGSTEGSTVLSDLHFQDELKELLDYIETTKAEISGIRPKHLSESELPDASDQLDAVVTATEEAAGKIMDAAEEIGELAAKSKGKMAKELERISTDIFEASSFQDITGQRVTKVVNTLKHLEERLASLAKAIGDNGEGDDDGAAKSIDEMENKDFLNGPQLEHSANDQDAIDALMASFD